MTVDIRPILKGETEKIDFRFDLNIEEGINDVSFPEPFAVDGSIENRAGLVTLRLVAEVPFLTHCARCLREIRGVTGVVTEKTVADENAAQNKENDDYVFPVDGEILIDPLLDLTVLTMCDTVIPIPPV